MFLNDTSNNLFLLVFPLLWTNFYHYMQICRTGATYLQCQNDTAKDNLNKIDVQDHITVRSKLFIALIFKLIVADASRRWPVHHGIKQYCPGKQDLLQCTLNIDPMSADNSRKYGSPGRSGLMRIVPHLVRMFHA